MIHTTSGIVDEHVTEDVLKHSKVVGIKGIKANQTVCREKARRSTMLTYVNVARYALPPMVIHKESSMMVQECSTPGPGVLLQERVYQ